MNNPVGQEQLNLDDYLALGQSINKDSFKGIKKPSGSFFRRVISAPFRVLYYTPGFLYHAPRLSSLALGSFKIQTSSSEIKLEQLEAEQCNAIKGHFTEIKESENWKKSEQSECPVPTKIYLQASSYKEALEKILKIENLPKALHAKTEELKKMASDLKLMAKYGAVFGEKSLNKKFQTFRQEMDAFQEGIKSKEKQPPPSDFSPIKVVWEGDEESAEGSNET